MVFIRLPRYGYTPVLLLPETSGLIRISFEIYDITSLPPPFPTKCRDYRKAKPIPLEGRGHCFEECFIHESKKHLGGKVLAGPVVQQDLPSHQLPQNALSSGRESFFYDMRNSGDNRTHWKGIQKLYSRCEKVCSQGECQVDFYVPTLISSHGSQLTGGIMMFQVRVNQVPPVNITFAPKQSFINLMTTTTAMCGFWFGLSFLAIMQFSWDVSLLIIENLWPRLLNRTGSKKRRKCRKCHKYKKHNHHQHHHATNTSHHAHRHDKNNKKPAHISIEESKKRKKKGRHI